MEERFQRYRDRVQIVYMYVREAHPNPDRAPCGSTQSLGWTHPSAVTLSKAERAQRARWLSKDRDLSFPWIIDDVDNTWFSEY